VSATRILRARTDGTNSCQPAAHVSLRLQHRPDPGPNKTFLLAHAFCRLCSSNLCTTSTHTYTFSRRLCPVSREYLRMTRSKKKRSYNNGGGGQSGQNRRRDGQNAGRSGSGYSGSGGPCLPYPRGGRDPNRAGQGSGAHHGNSGQSSNAAMEDRIRALEREVESLRRVQSGRVERPQNRRQGGYTPLGVGPPSTPFTDPNSRQTLPTATGSDMASNDVHHSLQEASPGPTVRAPMRGVFKAPEVSPIVVDSTMASNHVHNPFTEGRPETTANVLMSGVIPSGMALTNDAQSPNDVGQHTTGTPSVGSSFDYFMPNHPTSRVSDLASRPVVQPTTQQQGLMDLRASTEETRGSLRLRLVCRRKTTAYRRRGSRPG